MNIGEKVNTRCPQCKSSNLLRKCPVNTPARPLSPSVSSYLAASVVCKGDAGRVTQGF